VSFFSLILVLFLIMDPLGNIQAFLFHTGRLSLARRRAVVLREMCIALAAAIVCSLIGKRIFSVLEISSTTVYFASGVILFLVALKILFPKPQQGERKPPEQEPFLVPLAIPLISGPALLATVMLYADTEPSPWTMLAAICIAWLLAIIILLNAARVLRVLTTNGLTACEKLMGMVLVLLAVQRFLEGVVQFIKT